MQVKVNRTLYILSLIGAFLLGVCLVGSIFLIRDDGPGHPSNSMSGDDKFSILKSYVDQYYLGDYDEYKMMEEAYKGYIKGLDDPYSQYMDPEEYKSFMVSAMGSYSGVGITFTQDENGNMLVLEVTKDSPAERAGIEPGDFLLTIDGEVYENTDEMATKIRGEEGTAVTIEYSRDGEVKKVKMIREQINQVSVEYEMLDGNIGYIKVSSFIDDTSEDFDKALNNLQKKKAKGLVLDLRDNGGGLVDESVDIADHFLDEGVVCYTEDKAGNTDSYEAKDGKTDIPTVILINGNSASASEILAGALKDNGYTLVGEKSFGKGVIQSTVELKDGSALKLTIMQYLSPDKNVIHKKGIKPDVKIKDKEKTEKDEQLDKALEVLGKQ